MKKNLNPSNHPEGSGMAAQPGAASNRPGASGRKRSWNADPPAFAKVVRVEPFAPPVRLEIYSLALRRSDARAENARAVQQLFDGEVLDVGDRTGSAGCRLLSAGVSRPPSIRIPAGRVAARLVALQ